MKIQRLKDAMKARPSRPPLPPRQHHHHPPHWVCGHWSTCSCGYCYDCGTYLPRYRWQWVWEQSPFGFGWQRVKKHVAVAHCAH